MSLPQDPPVPQIPPPRPSRLASLALLSLLYVLGFWHWTVFLNLGSPVVFHVNDWFLESRYYSGLADGLRHGALPYHVSQSIHGTNRLWANPELLVSPQALLLLRMPIPTFFLVNLLLLYSIGFIGCALLRERYRLSALPFAFFFLLFNFNGHLVAHLAVGHTIWTGYFLLPFFLLFVLKLVEGDDPARLRFPLAFLLLAIFMQGFFHLFNACMLFLLLLALFHRAYWRPVLAACAAATCLSAFRLVPAAITFFHRPYSISSGYPSPLELLQGLVLLRDWRFPATGGAFGGLYWWEYDLYVGLAGFCALAYFGVYLGLPGRDPLPGAERYRRLYGPMLAMTLLSLNYFFAPALLLHLPFASAERIPARLVLVPFVFLMALATIRLEAVWSRLSGSPQVRALGWAALLLVAFALYDHSSLWQLTHLVAASAPVPADGGLLSVVHEEGDALYVALARAACLASLISALVVVYLAVRCTRRATHPQKP